MNLQDIFEQLSAGEFSQLRIAGQDNGVINAENAKQIVQHINLGLTALHARFLLRQGRLTLKLIPNQYSYLLDNQYAEANQRSREPVKYILDSMQEPFRNDIHKVEQVFTDRKVEMPLNDLNDLYSCFTPNLKSIVVPEDVVNGKADIPDFFKTTSLDLVYRANHPILTLPIGLFNPKGIKVDLPASHLEALLYYVASRVHNPVGMVNEFHMGNSYYAKYEAACQLLEAKGMQVNTGGDLGRFARAGWV